MSVRVPRFSIATKLKEDETSKVGSIFHERCAGHARPSRGRGVALHSLDRLRTMRASHRGICSSRAVHKRPPAVPSNLPIVAVKFSVTEKGLPLKRVRFPLVHRSLLFGQNHRQRLAGPCARDDGQAWRTAPGVRFVSHHLPPRSSSTPLRGSSSHAASECVSQETQQENTCGRVDNAK